MQGYGTVRDVEETEKEGEKPVQECRIADSGQLPGDTDLTSIPTFIAQVCTTTRFKSTRQALSRIVSNCCVEWSARHRERRSVWC